jgi:pimeloyl-ACP methyl ester carboxylesterase
MPTITLDDLSIHYEHKKADTDSKSKKVLYIHGTGCNSSVFIPHMELMQASRETIAIDLPGHGRSSGKGFRGVADHAHICSELITAIGWTDCAVAGHSLGGGVALALALIYPEQVSELIMIDSGARLRVNPTTINLAKARTKGQVTDEPNSRVGFAKAASPSLVARTNRLMIDCDPNVILRDWIADDTCDFMARVKDICIPTLAICGLEDELTPVKYSEYLTKTMSNCMLKIIEDAGHWTFLEQPQVFFDHIDGWLSQIDKS